MLNSAYSLRKILFDSHVDLDGVRKTKSVTGSSKVYVSDLVAYLNVILTVSDILQKPLYCTTLARKKSSSTSSTPSRITQLLPVICTEETTAVLQVPKSASVTRIQLSTSHDQPKACIGDQIADSRYCSPNST